MEAQYQLFVLVNKKDPKIGSLFKKQENITFYTSLDSCAASVAS